MSFSLQKTCGSRGETLSEGRRSLSILWQCNEPTQWGSPRSRQRGVLLRRSLVFYASFCTRHSRSVQSHLLTYTPTVPTGAFAQKSSGTMVPIFGAIMCNTKTLYHFVLCFYTLSSCVDAVCMCIILNHCIQKLYSKSSGQHTTLHPKWALFQACALLVESLDTVIVYVTDWYCPAYIF